MKLKPCPLCGSEPKWSFTPDKKHKLMRGLLCSNGECGWSFGCVVFYDDKDATNYWNKKVEERRQLQEWSKALHKCKCGGSPELVLERYAKFGEGWYVRCPSCQKSQSTLSTRERAIEAWNRRAE